MTDCVFCKIAKGEIPAQKVYEDTDIMIIKDIFPKAKTHFLMIPKEHYLNINELNQDRADIIAKGLLKIKELAPSLGLSNGYRLVTNSGHDAYQSVMHLHFHILGGEFLTENFGSDAFAR